MATRHHAGDPGELAEARSLIAASGRRSRGNPDVKVNFRPGWHRSPVHCAPRLSCEAVIQATWVCRAPGRISGLAGPSSTRRRVAGSTMLGPMPRRPARSPMVRDRRLVMARFPGCARRRSRVSLVPRGARRPGANQKGPAVALTLRVVAASRLCTMLPSTCPGVIFPRETPAWPTSGTQRHVAAQRSTGQGRAPLRLWATASNPG